ncbi:chaperone modulator CbpM [Sabulicella rubraurantiaca]|uniref:chaperone modulator CbpM n=1 Tax=Sabulicella rubraurantiaca TaxID=2811429 RepID=UPI001A96E423|nr:chaperone modulator CbpM [Sabulicella rubraurantiaca]
MYGHREFLLRAQLDTASLDAWIAAGWLAPRQAGPQHTFSEIDLSRACLIRDLRESMGVNDEGIDVVLGLLDQVYGLRDLLGRLSVALRALPEPLRQEILMQIQDRPEEVAKRGAGDPPLDAG